MPELDDMQLLGEYVRDNSQEAFTTLVQRHINLVYTAAFRHVHDPHQAQDITQAVFIILAQKAPRLRRETILSGWLYQTARLTSASFIRGEIRRERREHEAFMQANLIDSHAEPGWEKLAPILDDAMARLGEKERNVIVLRFFQGRTVAEVATALALNEPAAKKRVTRALDRLRKFFVKRGIVISATVLAGALGTNAVQAAPVGAAVTIATVAATKGTTAGLGTLTLIKTTLKLMAWAKFKTAIAIGTVILFAAGATAFVVQETAAPAAAPIPLPTGPEGAGPEYFAKLSLSNFPTLVVKFTMSANSPILDGTNGAVSLRRGRARTQAADNYEFIKTPAGFAIVHSALPLEMGVQPGGVFTGQGMLTNTHWSLTPGGQIQYSVTNQPDEAWSNPLTYLETGSPVYRTVLDCGIVRTDPLSWSGLTFRGTRKLEILDGRNPTNRPVMTTQNITGEVTFSNDLPVQATYEEVGRQPVLVIHYQHEGHFEVPFPSEIKIEQFVRGQLFDTRIFKILDARRTITPEDEARLNPHYYLQKAKALVDSATPEQRAQVSNLLIARHGDEPPQRHVFGEPNPPPLNTLKSNGAVVGMAWGNDNWTRIPPGSGRDAKAARAARIKILFITLGALVLATLSVIWWQGRKKPSSS